MSAYIVSDEHINVLTASIYGLVPYPTLQSLMTTEYLREPGARDRIGQILRDENVRSVNRRYDEDDMVFYQFEEPSHRFSSVEVLKALACYEYQSCEAKGWEISVARALCAELRLAIIRHLPGYEEAAWEIDADTVPIMED